MSNPLWDYSLVRYGQNEVAKTCLALQDAYGLDVNVLLYAAWLAHGQRGLSDDHLAALEASVSAWRTEVVKPLRALRRQLRTNTGAAGIHDALKALELRAEREQQDLMYAFYRRAQVLPCSENSLLENLTRVAQMASPDNLGWKKGVAYLASLIAS